MEEKYKLIITLILLHMNVSSNFLQISFSMFSIPMHATKRARNKNNRTSFGIIIENRKTFYKIIVKSNRKHVLIIRKFMIAYAYNFGEKPPHQSHLRYKDYSSTSYDAHTVT